MGIAANLVSQDMIEKNKLQDKIKDKYIYMRIIKVICGLCQLGRVETELLKKQLGAFGYWEVNHTPGLFKHDWSPMRFALVFDDFGTKCIGNKHTGHMLAVLNKYYDMTIYWDGTLY